MKLELLSLYLFVNYEGLHITDLLLICSPCRKRFSLHYEYKLHCNIVCLPLNYICFMAIHFITILLLYDAICEY